jgi:hypothetical protein
MIIPPTIASRLATNPILITRDIMQTPEVITTNPDIKIKGKGVVLSGA